MGETGKKIFASTTHQQERVLWQGVDMYAYKLWHVSVVICYLYPPCNVIYMRHYDMCFTNALLEEEL